MGALVHGDAKLTLLGDGRNLEVSDDGGAADAADSYSGNGWVEGRVMRTWARSLGFGVKRLSLQVYVGADNDVAALLKMKVAQQGGNTPLAQSPGVPQEPAHLEVVLDSSSAEIQPLYSCSPRWRASLADGHEVMVRLQPGLWVEGTVIADTAAASGDDGTILIQLDSSEGSTGAAPMFVRLSRYSDELATTFVSLSANDHNE